MTVGYEVTLEEVVEVGYKAVTQSKIWLGLVARRRFGISLLNAFVGIVVLQGPDIQFRLVFGGVTALMTALVWFRYEKWHLKRNLRQLTRGYFGQSSTTEFGVTLANNGLEVSMLGS